MKFTTTALNTAQTIENVQTATLNMIAHIKTATLSAWDSATSDRARHFYWSTWERVLFPIIEITWLILIASASTIVDEMHRFADWIDAEVDRCQEPIKQEPIKQEPIGETTAIVTEAFIDTFVLKTHVEEVANAAITLEELREIAKRLKIRGYNLMKEETLKRKIAEVQK